MSTKRYIVTSTPTDLQKYEDRIREAWTERATKKNDRIIGEGYADRQKAATLSKVEPIDLHVSRIGKNRDALLRRGIVIDTLADHFKGEDDRVKWQELFADILEDVPEIKPNKSAEWIRDMDRDRRAPGLKTFYCNSCLTYNDKRSNYCPNCGAYMKGKR